MYQALYRQYRPKSFEELLGQKHITVTLSHQVKKGNIGHAYLFSGTRGTGKTSAAKIFSRAVNCLNPNEGNPCNECEICRGILDESIMDVMEMDAASNNSVDDVRDLKEKVIYPPARARFKVYIIDEVHMLSKGAFNALLKTLEEPPKHLIFILATTEPERLPQTILSRCQKFDFKRITTKDIMENMRNISEKIGVEIDESALNLIARNSDGAMRDALSLLDQCISFNAEKVTYQDAINILGIANKDLIFNMVYNIKEKNLEEVLVAIDEIIQNGKDINQFIRDVIHHFRDLMIAKTSKNPKEIMEAEDIDEYIKQSNILNLSYILKSLEILTSAEAQGKWSTQPRIILEMAAIKLVNLDEELSLEERIKRLEMGMVPSNTLAIGKEAFSNTKKPQDRTINEKEDSHIETNIGLDVKKEPNNATVDNSTVNIEFIESQWPKIMQKIKSKKINIYALIMEGELISFENDQLIIGYKDGFEFHKDAVNSPQNKEFIEGIVSEHFNKKININLLMKGCIPKKALKKDPNDKSDEVIKEVIDFFGKDIVEIK